jgi:membrane dipeptidase
MLMIDGHADTPQRFADEAWDFVESELGDGHLNLETARNGGLSAQFFALWAEPAEWRGRYAQRTQQLIDAVHEQVRRHPHELVLGVRAGDVERAFTDGRFCVLMGVEGGHSIENDLALLREYFRRGVRYMTLTWANSNEWADSSGDLDDPAVPHHGGLSGFGREVVREMNRLGMMVDVSHVSDATFAHVMEASRAPVIASHSSARALAASPRNLSDEQLRAVAAGGGLVMVNFYPAFLDNAWREAWSATAAERARLYAAAGASFRERGEPVPYTIALRVDREFHASTFAGSSLLPVFERAIDHIDHIAKIAGVDHVGLGSDFDGFGIAPKGLESAADMAKIPGALRERGYTQEQVSQILGGNMLRVMRAVEAAAE